MKTDVTSVLFAINNSKDGIIKTCKARLVDSCSYLSMPLNNFSETFNIPNVKGTFPYLFNKSGNYGYVDKLPDISFYDPDGMKEPARAQFIKCK